MQILFEHRFLIVLVLLIYFTPRAECLADSEKRGVEINGITYNVLEIDGRYYATVVKKQSGLYSGNVVIPSSITCSGNEFEVRSIGRFAFSNSLDLTSVVIPNSIKFINLGAFSNCVKLKSINIPSSVSIIDPGVFTACDELVDITVDKQNKTFDSRDNCNAVIKTESNTLVAGCKTTKIPKSITKIGREAFYFNRELSSITIPENVNHIYAYAFMGCNKLENVISEIDSPFELDSNAFKDISSEAVLNVPEGTKDKYISLGWNQYFKEIVEYKNEPNYCTLSISASGNGSASYGNTNIKNETKSLTLNEGASITITFTPDDGCRIKFVKVDGHEVSASNNSYTISGISSNTTVEVEFEKVNNDGGYLFKVSGIAHGLSSRPVDFDAGRVWGVVEGVFEVINPFAVQQTTVDCKNDNYTKVIIDGNEISTQDGVLGNINPRDTNDGNPALTLLPPASGSVIQINAKKNGWMYVVTKFLMNKPYMVFEDGRPIGYKIALESKDERFTEGILNLDVKGDGENNYIPEGRQIQWVIREYLGDIEAELASTGYSTGLGVFYFPVVSGHTYYAHATGAKIPWSGIYFNETEAQNISVSNDDSSNTLSILSNYGNDNVVRSYGLSINAIGKGAVLCNGSTIRNQLSCIPMNEGKTATITFSPDEGYYVKKISINKKPVSTSNNNYSISNISENTLINVEFEAFPTNLNYDEVSYIVVSNEEKTVRVLGGNNGNVLTVPTSFEIGGFSWKVVGIEDNALENSPELASIIWNPEESFTASISNPNLLLYVKSANYAPSSVKNVVVNGVANSITLTDASSGNNFYCPQEFTARSISYTHNYGMATGIGDARGWETIALPFDVQKVTHVSKGEIVPFAKWSSGDEQHPFWLMEQNSSGWSEATCIRANTPYIISMPNHKGYKTEFLLNGSITFSAENVTVAKTDDFYPSSYSNRSFIPNFTNLGASAGLYALNVSNDYEQNNSGSVEGSKFILNLRPVHPFEAYMTSTASTRSIDISEGMTTEIRGIVSWVDDYKGIKVYNLKGQQMKVDANSSADTIIQSLPAGVYIVDGQKFIIK